MMEGGNTYGLNREISSATTRVSSRRPMLEVRGANVVPVVSMSKGKATKATGPIKKKKSITRTA